MAKAEQKAEKRINPSDVRRNENFVPVLKFKIRTEKTAKIEEKAFLKLYFSLLKRKADRNIDINTVVLVNMDVIVPAVVAIPM